MMEALRNYLLHLVAAALICGVVGRLFRGSAVMSTIVKLLCGMFLLYSIIHPMPEVNIHEFEMFTDELSNQAAGAVEQGVQAAQKAWSERIKQQTQAYILEKAKSMNTDLTVEVELSDDDMSVPTSVRISGHISPYVKERLSTLIEDELGIDKEHQKWT